MKTYQFNVETLEAGQRRSYGDSYYSYEITSSEPEYEVKAFCMNVLKISYQKKDMPNPFTGELLEFKKTTNNNEGKEVWGERKPETYSYKVRTEYTG